MKTGKTRDWRPEVLIKHDGSIFSEVFIDGKQLRCVKRVEFIHDVRENGGSPIFRLDLLADSVTIDSRVIPELPDAYKAFYKRKTPEEMEEERSVFKEKLEFTPDSHSPE